MNCSSIPSLSRIHTVPKPAQFPDCDDYRFKLFKVYKKHKMSSVLAQLGMNPAKSVVQSPCISVFDILFLALIFSSPMANQMVWNPHWNPAKSIFQGKFFV